MTDRRIKITYDVVTPESAEQGDFAETGWIDEEGVLIEPDEYDRSIMLECVELGIRDFNRLTKDWHYAGCDPKELAAFIKGRIK